MRPCHVSILLCLVVPIACSAADRDERAASAPPASTNPADPNAPGGPGGGPGGTGGGPGGSSADGGDAGPQQTEPPVPYVPFDINHVVSTGQSNSVAHEGRPVLSATQPFNNVMFDVGVMTSGTCEQQGCRTYQSPSSFVPLAEGDTFWYPVETMSSGMANQAAMLARTKHGKPTHDLLVSLAGRNGLTYWCLRKGTCNFVDQTYLQPFDESMKQVADGKALAIAAGKSYVVRAVTAVHGESDDYGYAVGTPEFPVDGTDGKYRSITSYADGLLEWQRDYEAGIKAITGQTLPVPLLISQFSGWNDVPTSAVTQLQYEAHLRSQGKVVLVTPAYALDWASDCRHYTATGERQLGEYFGKAYARIVLEGRRWEPVHPKTVAIAGNVITAEYHVPVPPLVLDTQRVTDPGDKGFEVVDAGGNRLAIASVAVSGPDAVTITLAAPPPGKVHLRYAFTHPPHTCTGRLVGARGNLRDSDATPSQNGFELFNWGVHYDVAVP